MTDRRTLWFGAGPARWPEPVIERIKAEIGPDSVSGLSVLELSHRGDAYSRIHENAIGLLQSLLEVPESHVVLLLAGGASMQFVMVPANLRRPGQSADFVLTGAWSRKAASFAQASGSIRVAASGEETAFRAIPPLAAWNVDPEAAYLHITTNNTIAGTQHGQIPSGLVPPLVADASSDILTRELPLDRLALIYAGAQKCLGPAGLGIVVIREDLLDRAPDQVPPMLRYRDHAKADSRLNTPPTALVFMMTLMLEWIVEEGGATEMRRRAAERARIVYEVLDRYPDVYEPFAAPGSRSMTNVVFRLREKDAEKTLIARAAEHALGGLGGHRSVGGLRASMYTGMPVDGAAKLAAFLADYAEEQGRYGA